VCVYIYTFYKAVKPHLGVMRQMPTFYMSTPLYTTSLVRLLELTLQYDYVAFWNYDIQPSVLLIYGLALVETILGQYRRPSSTLSRHPSDGTASLCLGREGK
jgi:hypothetical protein